MDNTYYILSKEKVKIERFHFCTWDISKISYVEFGIELEKECFLDKELILYLTSQSFSNQISTTCLFENLSDESNCRFIFNDVVKNKRPIDGDIRNGYLCEFESRNRLTILPCSPEMCDGYCKIALQKPKEIDGNVYFRFLIQLNSDSVAEVRKSITRTNHIYDIKVNESRNIPDKVFTLKKQENLIICDVNKMFCLHAVPDDYNINFIVSSSLKNIRKLETSAFKKYLPMIEGIRENHSNIVFLKEEKKESYSFFTIFTEETVSSVQLAIAIGTNIICSLLFAISSLRFSRNIEITWWQQIPCEYWIAFGLLLLLCVYLFTPIKNKLK